MRASSVTLAVRSPYVTLLPLLHARRTCIMSAPSEVLALGDHHRLDMGKAPRKRISAAKRLLAALPEIARHMLPTGFDVRDRAATVADLGREPGLAIPSGMAVGGQLRAKRATRLLDLLRFPHNGSPSRSRSC